MGNPQTSLEAGAKCIRLTEMLAEMLAELRSADDDEALRRILIDVHRRIVSEVDSAVPEALDAEIHRLSFVLSDSASIGELRVAQAQLVGWLEGLMGSLRVTLNT